MEWFYLILIGAIIVICVAGQIFGFMNFRSDKDWRRTSGNLLGPIDGLFAPNRQEALQEQERQTELPAPAPAPGDPLLDLENGIAKIDLTERRN
jgi:hypothetical protein